MALNTKSTEREVVVHTAAILWSFYGNVLSFYSSFEPRAAAMMISEASLATSVPWMPIAKPTSERENMAFIFSNTKHTKKHT